MAESETTRMVALTSLDGQRFEVPEKVAAVSNFVRTTLEGKRWVGSAGPQTAALGTALG